jgi:hypothetical protein
MTREIDTKHRFGIKEEVDFWEELIQATFRSTGFYIFRFFIIIIIVTDLLKALSYGARNKPLLSKNIPNAGNDIRMAVSIIIEENDHC